MNRTDIATISHWTLQRREFGTGVHDYVIQANDHRPFIDMDVVHRSDSQAERTIYEVTIIPPSRQLDLDEAAKFTTLVQEAVIAAYSFQHTIETAEVMEEDDA